MWFRLLPVMFYNATRGFGVASFMLLYPLYLLSIGYTTSDIGLFATLGAIPVVLLIPLFGYLVDNGFSREVLFSSGVFLSLALILPTLFPTYPVLILSYTLLNTSMYTWMPSRTKIIAYLVPATMLGRVYALFIIPFNSARTATPLVLSRLTYIGYDKLMLTIGTLLLVTSTLLYMLLRVKVEEPVSKSFHVSGLAENYRNLFTFFGKSALPLVLFVSLDSFAWRLWFPLLNAYFKQYRGFGDTQIGDYMTLQSLAMLIASYTAGSITDKLRPVRSLAIYEVLGVLGVAALQLNPPYTFIAAIILGFSIAFWVTAYNSLLTILYGYGVIGRLRALTDTTRSIASIPAPQIGGYLLLLSPVLPFAVSATAMLLAIVPIAMVREERSGEEGLGGRGSGYVVGTA